MTEIQEALYAAEAWLTLPGVVGCAPNHDNSKIIVFTNGNIAEEQFLRLTLPRELQGYMVILQSLAEEHMI